MTKPFLYSFSEIYIVTQNMPQIIINFQETEDIGKVLMAAISQYQTFQADYAASKIRHSQLFRLIQKSHDLDEVNKYQDEADTIEAQWKAWGVTF